MLRALVPALILVLGLVLPEEARAGGKVDWSEYLEPPGARPIQIKHTETAPLPETKRAGKAAKAKPAKQKKTAAAKKAKSKKKGGRRR